MFIRIFLMLFFISNTVIAEECDKQLPVILDLKSIKDKISVADVIFDNKMLDMAELLSKNNAKMRDRANKINSLSNLR